MAWRVVGVVTFLPRDVRRWDRFENRGGAARGIRVRRAVGLPLGRIVAAAELVGGSQHRAVSLYHMRELVRQQTSAVARLRTIRAAAESNVRTKCESIGLEAGDSMFAGLVGMQTHRAQSGAQPRFERCAVGGIERLAAAKDARHPILHVHGLYAGGGGCRLTCLRSMRSRLVFPRVLCRRSAAGR